MGYILNAEFHLLRFGNLNDRRCKRKVEYRTGLSEYRTGIFESVTEVVCYYEARYNKIM